MKSDCCSRRVCDYGGTSIYMWLHTVEVSGPNDTVGVECMQTRLNGIYI
jgi:hypothetical protein